MNPSASERIAAQLAAAYAHLLPEGQEIQDLLDAGVSPRKILTLYPVAHEQWPAIFQQRFSKAENVAAFTEAYKYPFNQIEAAQQGKFVSAEGWSESVLALDLAERTIFSEMHRKYKDDAAMTEVVYCLIGKPLLPSSVNLRRTYNRCLALMEVLIVAGWWPRLPQLHSNFEIYEQQLRGAIISLGLQPLHFEGAA